MVVMGNCCISTPSTSNTEKPGFHGQILTTESSAEGDGGLNKKETKNCTRLSNLYYKDFDNKIPPCRDAGRTSLHMCQYDSGTEDEHCRQTDQVKTMNKKAKSQSKKAKKYHGSTTGAPGQRADVKGRAARKDAYSTGPERSSDLTHTMQKHAQKETKPAQSDNRPSQQHLKTQAAEDDKGDLDLYRGEEEIEEELKKKHQPEAFAKSQHSVSAAEDLQTYSEREWRGNTSKSQLIRKGYEAIASEFSLRRVRGDNYCALRATLFQVLSQSKQLPAWLHDSDVVKWPKEMLSGEEFIKDWQFPFESRKGKLQHLEQCLELLKKKWEESVQCKGLEERERMCLQVFRGHDEEYELLEALKFIMLRTAVQLQSDMEKGSDVPEFCYLLFARDTSRCPKTLLTNHLRHVGFSGGLEQVEMCLLGHSLQQTIQVHRLYMYDTEEFVTYYPNDHRDDWPSLCLLTEDDRHYNALVPKKSSKFDAYGRPKWNEPSDGSSGITTRL